MDRREFLKSSLLLGGGLCAGFACASAFSRKVFEDIIKKNPESPFIYTKKTLPKHIQVEACNLCQLNCVKCWMREDEELIKELNGFEIFKL